MDIAHERTIIHVDMDAFFASVEQVLHPELQGRPVIVGGRSSDRSVVASASYEARARGVKTAMPIAAAHRRCPEGAFLRGTYHAYDGFSRQVEEILRRYTPLVQKTSLDDFYLDLTGCERLHGPALPTAERIKRHVRRDTGLNASLGIGGNRLIAKIASEHAKPNGIVEVRRGYEAAFLRSLEVGVIPGVGRRTGETLEKFNVCTAGDVARLSPELLEATFGRSGVGLWRHARGEDDSRVVEAGPPKSISRETTFEEDVDDRRRLEAMLYYLTERAAAHLRGLGMQARCVTVKVRFSDFQTPTRAHALPRPDDQDRVFFAAAAEMMHKLLARRMRVRLVGVALSALRAGRTRQGDLWTGPAADKRDLLYRALDRARERFGFSAVTAGPSLRLLNETEQDEHGFRLRTSCLSR